MSLCLRFVLYLNSYTHTYIYICIYDFISHLAIASYNMLMKLQNRKSSGKLSIVAFIYGNIDNLQWCK